MKALGPVGPEEENVQRFRAKKCGEGTPPADPPKAARPAGLEKLPLKCVDSTIVGHTVSLLDGTSVEHLAIRDDTIPTAGAVPVGVTRSALPPSPRSSARGSDALDILLPSTRDLSDPRVDG